MAVFVELLEIGLAPARWHDVGEPTRAPVVAGSKEDELATPMQVFVEHWVWDTWELNAAQLDDLFLVYEALLEGLVVVCMEQEFFLIRAPLLFSLQLLCWFGPGRRWKGGGGS